MAFWQQLNQLLSESPGNIIYHLVTLFAIQATLAVSLSQWRREREDNLARRMALGSLALLVVRLLFLLVSLVLSGNSDRLAAIQILPPLEQVLNSITVLLIVWTVIPPLVDLPRLNDVALILLLLLLGVMYTFLAQDWIATAEPGLTYNSSEQSTIWGLFQMSVLGIGALVLIFQRFPSGGLRFFPVLVLLVAHAVQFWDYPEMIPSNTEIPFWIRLGHLVAFPLLAVLAYRHTISRLLLARLDNRLPSEQLAESLWLATRVINSPTLGRTMQEAVAMVNEAVDAPLIILALLDLVHPSRLAVLRRSGVDGRLQEWQLNLNDWPAFRLAIEQEQMVELLPAGLGARQLHDLYHEMGVSERGPLVVVPLQTAQNVVGLLVLGGSPDWERWPAEQRQLIGRVADYVGRAIYNAQAYEMALENVAPITPSTEALASGRLIALEEERDRALEKIETLDGRLQQAESWLAASQQQARDLAATLEAVERLQPPDEQAGALEAEVSSLRESLIEAEEALAMAAAGESELSTEWVMLTISRYSAELEETRTRISDLEAELSRRDTHEIDQVVTSLIQELRTPLTSIAGYTELLLGETMGILGKRQRDFLERVRANVERMGVLLEQIVQIASAPTQSDTANDVELVDIQEVIDTAVGTVLGQVREKNLCLNLSISENIPPTFANREALCQMLIHLLSNASQASASDSAMTVRVQAYLGEVEARGNGETARFIRLTVEDSGGGIPTADRPHVFDPQYRADNPLVPGLGDTGAGLTVAQKLVHAYGGRIWLESEMGRGSTFSVLLPLYNKKPGNNGYRSGEVNGH